ncbi:TraR/DksA family transcriptional regulator [Ornithinimicrobium sp. Y1847]|uniref:TraR/DksA family transcriptional regulator n=1 Tax=unclassified Ornithinimicrobium TaxID=2615080 RepID=UPI003B685DDB
MARTKKDVTSAHEGLGVGAGEDPWTAEELAEVRAELESEQTRLQEEVDASEQDLVELARSYGDGAGDDQADAGAATWEREHELSLANNAKDLLEQTSRALARIDEGSYGECESCGQPIGKMRLQAFPRATLCMTCKQKQERR